MSQKRFIRCKHCGMPHEAGTRACPLTGAAIEAPSKRRRSSLPFDGPQWQHPVAVEASGDADAEGADSPSPSVARFMGRLVEGKYRIEELIGKGGMGAVYKAEHVRLGKKVAIKVLIKGHRQGSAAERRFLREARVAGAIGHPNIVQVFDLGTLEDGSPFLVMELLEGHTLHERIQLIGAIPIADVYTIGEQILSGLSAAHAKGIVHRDMKPDNVFLTEQQGSLVAKLLDFGISKNLDDNTMSLTRTGAVVGTPYYLAPEQARGAKTIDHRVDIWAAGVLLYEASTGMLPFDADNYNALLVKILNQRPSPPSALRPSLPSKLEGVVMRALAYDVEERFESADRMLAALRDARGAETHVAPGLDTDPRLLAELRDRTVADFRLSEMMDPGPDDPTEISDSFSHFDIQLPKIDESS